MGYHMLDTVSARKCQYIICIKKYLICSMQNSEKHKLMTHSMLIYTKVSNKSHLYSFLLEWSLQLSIIDLLSHIISASAISSIYIYMYVNTYIYIIHIYMQKCI